MTGLPWKLIVRPDEAEVHVVPVEDLCLHETRGTDCVCGPVVETKEDALPLILHASLDGRELDE